MRKFVIFTEPKIVHQSSTKTKDGVTKKYDTTILTWNVRFNNDYAKDFVLTSHSTAIENTEKEVLPNKITSWKRREEFNIEYYWVYCFKTVIRRSEEDKCDFALASEIAIALTRKIINKFAERLLININKELEKARKEITDNIVEVRNYYSDCNNKLKELNVYKN